MSVFLLFFAPFTTHHRLEIELLELLELPDDDDELDGVVDNCALSGAVDYSGLPQVFLKDSSSELLGDDGELQG